MFKHSHVEASWLGWIARASHGQAPATQQPEVGNSGFDHKTAADFLNGKTVSDEAVRKFVATSRWAHDERASLSATLLAMHGVLTSREAEIALLKKALLEAEAAPQQEPFGWVKSSEIESARRHGGSINLWRLRYDCDTPLYIKPQPAPAAQVDAPTDSGPISRQWLTVVYRGVEAGDEVQQICTHPKVSAMSWSHALHDRDAARKQGANHD